MEYTVSIITSTVTTVSAESEEQAIEAVRASLIASNQIKPTDPVYFDIVKEAVYDSETNSYKIN